MNQPLEHEAAATTAGAGFTLIELLVVLGVIAVLAAVVLAGIGVADKTVALRSAQATMAGAVNVARVRAMARGVNVGLAVHNDPASPGRYRRLVVVVEAIESNPTVVAVFELPKQVYVLPHRDRFSAALRLPGDWTGGNSGRALGSTFLGTTISAVMQGAATENWEYNEFTALGTLASGLGGTIIVGLGRPQAPGKGAAPIVFASPEQVSGMVISSYGLARMIEDRAGF